MKRLLLVLLISPLFLSTSHFISADTMGVPEVKPPVQKAIKDTPPSNVETVQALEVTPATVAQVVASVPVPSGCTTYWSGDVYLDNIIRFESGGNSCATNYLGCFGLLQACPGAPLKQACGGDPTCQIAWFVQFKTNGRTWAQVWQHELDFGWW